MGEVVASEVLITDIFSHRWEQTRGTVHRLNEGKVFL